MKNLGIKKKALFSSEAIALLADLNQKKFFSPAHETSVEVQGTLLLVNGSVVEELRSDEAVLYWWQEYEFQKGRAG